jgi:Flp pilus assembly protein TadG
MITFGIMAMVIVMAAGVGIDFARVNHSYSRLSTAADAAAIAAGKALLDGRNSDADVQRIATEFFNMNFKGGEGYAIIQSFTAKLDRSTNAVEIDIDAEVPMTLTKIAGVQKFDLPIRSVAIFNQQDIELGVQLDLTGSMSGQKIADLRVASADLVDILLPDAGTPNRVRIALAPYASGVNAGPYAGLISNNTSVADNCIYDRNGLLFDTDEAPTPMSFFKGRPLVAGSRSCPPNPIVPLTSDKALLKSEISRFAVTTTTAGHLGSTFAWATISPKWSAIWPAASRPAPYGDGKTVKAAILMTDGEYNTVDGNCDLDARGNANCGLRGPRFRKSNDDAKALCANMKREGVVVYTVIFQSRDPAAIDTLGTCATSADKFFRAENGDELRAAFANIAQNINNLRLSK